MSKSNLGRGGAKCCVVGSMEARGSGLKDVVDFFIVRRFGSAVQVLHAETVGNGVVNAFADCICLWDLNRADVGGCLAVDGVEFNPPCACVDHADGVDFCNFCVLCFHYPGTKKVDLHDIPWFGE
eukprot:948118-Ditylum_brightwellii.AAC.1